MDGFPNIEEDGADVVVVAPKLSPSKNEPDDIEGLVAPVSTESGIGVAAGGEGAGVTGSITGAKTAEAEVVVEAAVMAVGKVAVGDGKEASEIAGTAWNEVLLGDADFDDRILDNND